MSTLTANGIERAGVAVLAIRETTYGADLIVDVKWTQLNPAELRHVALLMVEQAVNAEKRASAWRDRDLPAVGSFGGC